MTEATQDPPSPSRPKHPTTVGEELFLVHLDRFDQLPRSPDDFDREHSSKQGGTTVGEELWSLHCKRSHNRQWEEHEEEETSASTIRDTTSSDNQGHVGKKPRTPDRKGRTIELRNRVVEA
jgi:hypothetical protein